MSDESNNLVDNLLSSMSSKINETLNDVDLKLNEDKTYKWRGLLNNDNSTTKRRKEKKRIENATEAMMQIATVTTTTTTTPPPTIAIPTSTTTATTPTTIIQSENDDKSIVEDVLTCSVDDKDVVLLNSTDNLNNTAVIGHSTDSTNTGTINKSLDKQTDAVEYIKIENEIISTTITTTTTTTSSITSTISTTSTANSIDNNNKTPVVIINDLNLSSSSTISSLIAAEVAAAAIAAAAAAAAAAATATVNNDENKSSSKTVIKNDKKIIKNKNDKPETRRMLLRKKHNNQVENEGDSDVDDDEEEEEAEEEEEEEEEVDEEDDDDKKEKDTGVDPVVPDGGTSTKDSDGKYSMLNKKSNIRTRKDDINRIIKEIELDEQNDRSQQNKKSLEIVRESNDENNTNNKSQMKRRGRTRKSIQIENEENNEKSLQESQTQNGTVSNDCRPPNDHQIKKSITDETQDDKMYLKKLRRSERTSQSTTSSTVAEQQKSSTSPPPPPPPPPLPPSQATPQPQPQPQSPINNQNLEIIIKKENDGNELIGVDDEKRNENSSSPAIPQQSLRSLRRRNTTTIDDIHIEANQLMNAKRKRSVDHQSTSCSTSSLSSSSIVNKTINELENKERETISLSSITINNSMDDENISNEVKPINTIINISNQMVKIPKKRGRKPLSIDRDRNKMVSNKINQNPPKIILKIDKILTENIQSHNNNNTDTIKTSPISLTSSTITKSPSPTTTSATTATVDIVLPPTNNIMPLNPDANVLMEMGTIKIEENIKIPKKRGRKPGTKLNIYGKVVKNGEFFNKDRMFGKKSSRLSKDSSSNSESVLASAIARREKINDQPTQRLSRRLKPTAKILANDELRNGFEAQNIARLSLSSENLDKDFERSPKNDGEQICSSKIITFPTSSSESMSVSISFSSSTSSSTSSSSTSSSTTSLIPSICSSSNNNNHKNDNNNIIFKSDRYDPTIGKSITSINKLIIDHRRDMDTSTMKNKLFLSTKTPISIELQRTSSKNHHQQCQSLNSITTTGSPTITTITPTTITTTKTTTITTTITTPSKPLNEYESNLPKNIIHRSCPDTIEFLNEIKLSKLNLNRSPEDNKKLNGKQKRRLLKLKEKHFNQLGLQRSIKSSTSTSTTTTPTTTTTVSINDSDVESDDLDEFKPTTKVTVAKREVPLRLRKEINTIGGGGGGGGDAFSIPPAMERLQNEYNTNNLNVNINNNNNINRIKDDNYNRQNKLRLLDGNNQMNKKSSSPQTQHQHQHQHQHSNTLTIKKEIDATICLCTKSSEYYAHRDTLDAIQCCAIDQIDKEIVGCNNAIDDEYVKLLRPSVRVKYLLLCTSHRRRLFAHNCCPGCGLFCTQGEYSLCSHAHFFHRNCATKFIVNPPYDHCKPNFKSPTLVLKCPHCGNDAPKTELYVNMKCDNVPVFSPSQLNVLNAIEEATTTTGSSPTGLVPVRAMMNFIKPKNELQTTPLTTTDSNVKQSLISIDIEQFIPESIVNILNGVHSTILTASSQQRYSNTSNLKYTTKSMFRAIHENNIEQISRILAHNFDITQPLPEFNMGTCLHLISHFGHLTMAYIIISHSPNIQFLNTVDKDLRTAMMCAVVGERNDIVKLLIQCGADVTIKGCDGMNVLHLAAKCGNKAAVEMIIESYRQCASVCYFERFINAIDDNGWTPLVWATDLGDSEIIILLLNCNASVNVCDTDNNTVLHWATQSNKLDIVLPLLMAKCDYSIQNSNGDTALHISCRNSNTQISLILLANGAKLNVKNNANEYPYDCIPNEKSQCAKVIKYNIRVRNSIGYGEHNVLCEDISNGRELYPVKLIANAKFKSIFTKGSDDERKYMQMLKSRMPTFKYITKSIVTKELVQIDERTCLMRICSCKDNCTSSKCECSDTSERNWYTVNGCLTDSFDFNDPALIFECTDVCDCNKLKCKNRIVQNGIRIPLQIFEHKHKAMGFGLRTLKAIKRGSFIAEYVGEILKHIDIDTRKDDSYVFSFGSSKHCIDARLYGNVCRFINHSCAPNTVPVRVYAHHHDLRFPKIAFFASRDIEANEEICFDYGEEYWIIKYKYFTCHCGASKCRFSDKTITGTIANYNQRTCRKMILNKN